MFNHRSHLTSFAAVILTLIAGCRGRAKQEMYDAQMAHEIRVLEDQLYEADYQNRVLIDKIESLQLKGSAPYYETPAESTLGRPSIPNPVLNPGQTPSAPSVDPLIEGFNDLDSIIDEGREEPLMPAPPSIENLNLPLVDPPKRDADPSTTPKKQPEERQPREDKRLGFLNPDSPYSSANSTESPPPDSSRSSARSTAIAEESKHSPLLAAPGGPEPPGINSLIAPPLIEGEMLPPPGKEPEEIKPPGQILLPEAAQGKTPQSLKLHPSLSGGVSQQGNIEEMMLVVNVLDQTGRPVELANYDVNAELSVVLFDGDQEQSSQTRLGRWDFNRQQIQTLVRDEPISGFHIPITWQDHQPEQHVVQAHVRLRSEAEEMRCAGTIKVEKANAITKWAPRGAPPR